jgi:hypothetical protein
MKRNHRNSQLFDVTNMDLLVWTHGPTYTRPTTTQCVLDSVSLSRLPLFVKVTEPKEASQCYSESIVPPKLKSKERAAFRYGMPTR